MPESNFHQEQRKDPKLSVFINYLEDGVLSQDEKEARKTATLATKFIILDKVLYFGDHKKTGDNELLCPAAFMGNCYSNIMEPEWLDIFQVTVYMSHFVIIGGGKTRMLMLSPFVGIVLSVLWLLVWEERNSHYCIQYP